MAPPVLYSLGERRTARAEDKLVCHCRSKPCGGCSYVAGEFMLSESCLGIGSVESVGVFFVKGIGSVGLLF